MEPGKKRTSQRGLPRPSGQAKAKARTPAAGLRAQAGKTASGKMPVAEGGGGHAGAGGATSTSGRKTPAGGEDRQPRREFGAEIGALRRRGLPLALKFSIYISVLIALVSLLFGLVVIRLFQTQVRQEIISSGEQQVLMLAALGDKAWDDIVVKAQDEKEMKALQASYSEQLKRLGPSDGGRVLDAAVIHNPSARVMSMYDEGIKGSLKAPSDSREVVTSRFDGIRIWKGTYARSGPERRALYFQSALRGRDGSAFLIMSTEEIDEEVRSLMAKTALFGLLFVAAGIALSLWLAGLITNPINLLVRDMDIVSRGDLDHEARPHSTDEIGLLAMAFNRMTKNLKEAQEHQREADRINSELNMAKEIAASLMPSKIPVLAGYDIFAAYSSAKEVGGDYYDFIPVDRTHLAFVAADASGKGIGAAMIMANARSALRMMSVGNLSAAEVLSKTNAVVTRDIKRGTFITVFYGVLDVPNRELTISSAGHDPMIVYRAATGRCESHNPNCVAIGFDPGPIFDKTVKEDKVKLNKGDRIVLYTDGVVESMDEEHEQWGFENLNAFVREHANMRSKDFVKALERALDEHKGNAEQHDDVTIVTFRVE